MQNKVLEIPSKLPNHNLPIHIVKHCNQYKEERVKNASLFAWITLSKLIDLSKVKFTKNGKPYLINNDKYFSLSHSCNMVAVVVDSNPVGIDLETVLPSNISSLLAKRILDKKQLNAYFKAKDREVWFTKHWTKYEAYTKLTGGVFDIKTFANHIKAKTIVKQIKNNGRTFILTIASVK